MIINSVREARLSAQRAGMLARGPQPGYGQAAPPAGWIPWPASPGHGWPRLAAE